MHINEEEYIEVEVFDVRSSSQATEAFSMILVDKNNKQRYVPIIIGLNEARAILGELHGRLPQRPLTHKLFVDLLTQFIPDYNLEFVSIVAYNQAIYFASIVIQSPTGTYFEVDARPSDAVAIALNAGIPIYFHKRLFEEQMQHSKRASDLMEDNAIIFPSGNVSRAADTTKAANEWETLSLSELKDLLQEAIDEEDYEQAAKIQEEIDKRKA